MRTLRCEHCHGHGSTRTDADLDADLLALVDVLIDTPADADPDARTTSGIAWKLGEDESRVVASLERLALAGRGVVKIERGKR